jgi:glycosyltransferase involved in cell wall biosynthesis
MRVLFATTWFPQPGQEATGVFVRRHAEALACQHELRVLHVVLGARGPVTEDRVGEHATGGLPVLRVPHDPRDPRSWRRLRSLARAELAGADLLHTNAFSTLLLLAGRHAVPWVHTEHWSGIRDPAGVGLWWRALAPTRHAYRLPDVVTAVSTCLAAVVGRYGGQVIVVPNVVTAPEPPRPPPAGDGPLLVATGALVPGKDPLTAVRTLAWLRDRGHPAHLTWLGAGPLAPAVEAEAGRLGVADHLTLAGAVPPDAVAARLAAAQVFVLPTRGETFCVAAAEALLAGRPVALGARGGQRDFVTSDVGRLVPQHTPEAFGRAVLEAAELARRHPATHFNDAVRERFSPSAVAEGFNRAYLLAASRSR